MPTLEEIKSQLRKLDGVESFLGRREIKELPSILWENESIHHLVQGLYDNGNGILVATNKRLIFINRGLIYGLKVEDFPYDKISSIQYETGMIFGKISIFSSGNRADIKQIQKAKARNFAEFVRAHIHSNSDKSSNDTRNDSTDTVSKLKELAQLKNDGILTKAEFERAKKKLLN